MPQPAVSIESLLEDGLWEQFAKRVGRIQSGGRFAKLLGLCNPNQTPRTIMEFLIVNTVSSSWYDKEEERMAIFCEFCSNVTCDTLKKLKVDLVSEEEGIKYISAAITKLWCDFSWDDNDWTLETFGQVSEAKHLRKIDHGIYTLWCKTILLIRSVRPNGFEKSLQDLHILHFIIQVELPKFLLWLALRVLPKDSIIQKDSLGRAPLHWAAGFDDYYSYRQCKADALIKTTTLQIVMDANPCAAKQTDNNGDSPLLILACESNQYLRNRCIYAQRLVDLAPQALEIPNNFGLLPFMVAAEGKDREEHINMTYTLLRRNPSVVRYGIKHSDREIWLTSKLNKAQNHIQALQNENEQLRAVVEKQQKLLNGTGLDRLQSLLDEQQKILNAVRIHGTDNNNNNNKSGKAAAGDGDGIVVPAPVEPIQIYNLPHLQLPVQSPPPPRAAKRQKTNTGT